jgi:hypothetical protein
MAKIVLFDDGDAGGLLIEEKEVRPLAVFDAGVRARIKAVSQLMVAYPDKAGMAVDRGELATLVSRLANLVVQQVEALAGSLDAEASLVVMSRDGCGFTCGTTGKPPVVLPAAPTEPPVLTRLASEGGIDRSLVTFVRAAIEAGRSVSEIFERPAEVAREMGVALSDSGAHDLAMLAPSRIGELADPVSREVVSFFQQVLVDGEHVDSWAIQPAVVARTLGIELSEQAAARIVAIGTAFEDGEQPSIIWIVVGIVVVVAVVVTKMDAGIVDHSGRAKF